MIIRGILDRSLSNQICIRGFARIKELARISKANPDYQRELIDKQVAKTSNFLTEENYLFFPEVILSLKLKKDLTKPGVNKENTPIQLIEKKKVFNSNVNSLSIKPIVKKNNKVFDVSENDTIVVVEIHFEDADLNKMIKDNQHPFHRVDGNHRLSAAEQIIDNDRINVMNIPFCIVLFEEITREQFIPEKGLMKITDDSYEKFERVVFYNINSKSIPLTIEENLRGILGEDKYFSFEEIDKIFEERGTPARLLGKRIIPEDFTSLKNTIRNNKWSMCLRLLQLYENDGQLIHYDSTEDLVNAIYDALHEVNLLYKKAKVLKQNPSIEILITFVYYRAFTDDSKFDFFTSWLIKNHLFNAEESTAKSIIKIFDQIFIQKHLKVFVAMPYWSDDKVNEYNTLFKEILKDTEAAMKSNAVLELIPIMRFTGESERIDKRLLDCIKECKIFIADITECNPNVLYEVAFAEGCNKPSILLKERKDTANPPFDMDKKQWLPYNGLTYYTDIKKKVNNNLKAILKDNYGLHF